MRFLDNYSDTKKEIDEYYKTRNNQFYNGSNNYNGKYSTNNNQYNQNGYNNLNPNSADNNTQDRYQQNCTEQSDNFQNSYFDNNQQQNKQDKVYVKSEIDAKVILVLLFIVFVIIMATVLIASYNSAFVIYIFFVMFSLAGLGIAFSPMIIRIFKKRHCKIALKGIVIDVKSKHSRNGGRTYAPIYEYSYMGTQYVARVSYRNYAVPNVGDEVTILINEANPKEFYVDNLKINILPIIIGLIFFALPIFLMFNVNL